MVTCLFSSGNVTLSFFKPCCSRCWSIWTVVFFQILVFNWTKFKVTFIFGLGGQKVKFFCGLVICIFEKSRETNFFFQNQAFNMVLRNVKLISHHLTLLSKMQEHMAEVEWQTQFVFIFFSWNRSENRSEKYKAFTISMGLP